MVEVKLILTVIVSGIAYAVGGWDKGLECMTIAVALDYLIGIVCAIYKKQFSYEICYRGIFKKIGFFAGVAVAVLIEKLIGQPDSLHPLVCFGFTVNEALSILRNLKILGVPIPDFFMKKVEDLSGKGEMK